MVIVLSVLSFGDTRSAFADDSVAGPPPPTARAGDCGWDNGIIPNGFNGRALSPPNFPDIRVVDDAVFDGACTIEGFCANVIEDVSWSPGDGIEFIVYADRGAGPGQVLHSVSTPFSRMATGDVYFGRAGYDYRIEGLDIALSPGTYWLGFRNPDGRGAGTNYWMTSDGGPDGIESDTGWFSMDRGVTWAPAGAGWHHAFVVNQAQPIGACCAPDASCRDDVRRSKCDARFVAGQQCADLDPPCGTGACCAPDGSCVDLVLPEDCSFRYVDGVLCEDLDPPCIPFGACCVSDQCVGNGTEEECRDLDGLWFAMDDCDVGFDCPEMPPCPWDNGIITDGRSGRALSPPSFPDIRVADDVTFEGLCQIVEFHAYVAEDDGWTAGEGIEFFVYADTGAGPGEVLHSVRTGFSRMSTGDVYFGRAAYDYWIEGLDLALHSGTYWIGFRSPKGDGSGTNYWMTSDGGPDGIETPTGWLSLNGGDSWAPEGAGWHHAFVVNPSYRIGACCEPDGACQDDVLIGECNARFVTGQRCADLNPPCGTGACCAPDGTCIDAVPTEDCPFRYAGDELCEDLDPPCVPLGACCGRDGTCTNGVREDECPDRFEAERSCEELDPPCEPIGACCAPDGICQDDVLEEGCPDRWVVAVLCADLDPPCVPLGACCARDGVCTDHAREDECVHRFAAMTLCEDLDPPCVPMGACCLDEQPCVRDPVWICDGDVNGDGLVGPVDSAMVRSAFGSADEQDLCNYDIDCDGRINPVDSGLVQSLFGTCEAPPSACAPCQSVSESTCGDLGGTFAGGATHCRRRPCSVGVCCLGGNCVGTMRRFQCEDLDGQFFEGEDCTARFECSWVGDAPRVPKILRPSGLSREDERGQNGLQPLADGSPPTP